MAVEVKREAIPEDIGRHEKRMELIRKYPPGETRGKKPTGALVGGVLSPRTAEQAYQAGFFALELSGEAVALVRPPEGFSPREW
ncbi:MAG: hypothetical protein LBD37_00075 [Treponema sp.]|jgi:hypothetical protein|nr:hypothetical protein [Treponema sp.]